MHEEGRVQQAKRSVRLLYEARFGTLPAVIAEVIEVVNDRATLERWIVLSSTRSHGEIEAAVLAERPALAS